MIVIATLDARVAKYKYVDVSVALSPVEVGGHFPPKIEHPGFFGWINEKILSTLSNIFNFKYHPKIIILIKVSVISYGEQHCAQT